MSNRREPRPTAPDSEQAALALHEAYELLRAIGRRALEQAPSEQKETDANDQFTSAKRKVRRASDATTSNPV